VTGQLDPHSSVAARIGAVSARAGSAQHRIFDHVARHPTDVLLSSANEIAAAVGASDATVIRTVQKLGYNGLREFKEDLRAAVSVAAPTRPKPQPRRASRPATGRRSIPRDMHAELREMIMAGELTSGVHVTESELAARLGVSRTPVREALRTLERNGLVVRSHQGITVPTQTRAEMNEVYDAHILLNGALVRRASERRSATDVDTLRQLNDAMHRMPVELAGSWEAAAANRRFHEATWEIARDRTLQALVRQLNDQLDLWPGTTLNAPGRWVESLDEHDLLIDAIEARDADEAEAVATRHLEAARRIRHTLLSR
jgi:DNA-binding GntR family transcriptional regulator